jgi:hypothetical protein
MTATPPRGADRVPSRAGVCAAWSVLMVGAFGCKGDDPQAPYRRFTPSPAEARRALEETLSAWRDASSALPESFGTRTARFVDKQRRPRQKLLGFQILGERDSGSARLYTVRLTLDNPEEVQLVRYYTLGRNPCWVFRQEDFEMMLHWEHGDHATAQ